MQYSLNREITEAVSISLKILSFPILLQAGYIIAQNHKGYIKVALKNACIDE